MPGAGRHPHRPACWLCPSALPGRAVAYPALACRAHRRGSSAPARVEVIGRIRAAEAHPPGHREGNYRNLRALPTGGRAKRPATPLGDRATGLLVFGGLALELTESDRKRISTVSPRRPPGKQAG